MRLEEMKRLAEIDLAEYMAADDLALKKKIADLVQKEVKDYIQVWIDAHDITDYDADGIMPQNLENYIKVDVDTLSSEIKATQEHVEKLAARVRMIMR